IWYKKISEGTVVWVANRETPINDTSGMFKVNREGNLLLFNGGNNMVWSSNSTVSFRSNNTEEVMAQLLMTLGECEMKCRKNCSCTAYTSLDIRNGGSGCLLWFDELMDIRESDSSQHIYIPMAAYDLEGRMFFSFDSNRRKRVFIIVLSMSLVVLLLSGLAYACRKTPYMKGLDEPLIKHVVL
ncbi:G-type lectin S-receptor-like serine/threonine-protein kinase isoform X1, partial [Tanacetum coccineum]